jgi:hypothetical protein
MIFGFRGHHAIHYALQTAHAQLLFHQESFEPFSWEGSQVLPLSLRFSEVDLTLQRVWLAQLLVILGGVGVTKTPCFSMLLASLSSR